MNERAEESRTSEYRERPLREINTRTLRRFLEQHRQWLGSDRKQGVSADLSDTNLQEADLATANLQEADLVRANLQGANLSDTNLQEAELRGANLQGANLSEANLQGANLSGAVLQGANLRAANLQEADLSVANLSGANLQEADLVTANLRGANLNGANLQGANLSGADLSGANLSGANLQEANLRVANLQEANLRVAKLKGADLLRANLEEADLFRANLQDAQLIQANLHEAHLSEANLEAANLSEADLQGATLCEAQLTAASLEDAILQGADLYRAGLDKAKLKAANLREANLQNATLIDVSGLLARQLAGANVSGTKLPEEIHKFEGLTIVEEASKNTRKIFLAMLLGCAYSALTIFSTKDAALLTSSASSPLPIIGTPIPIAGFFGVAPVILFAIYLYFHFYLQRLWEALADLPAVFPDGRPLDKRVYPWLLNGLVRSHFLHLKKDRPPLSRLQNLVSILLAWWAVPFTIALFWLRYLPRHEWGGTGFHLAFLVLAIVWAVWFQRLARITLRGQLPEPIQFEGNWRRARPYKQVLKRTYKLVAIGGIVLLFAVGVSEGAINGAPRWQEPRHGAVRWRLREIIPQVLPFVWARAFADISEQEVSTKPPNWFRDGELPQLVKGAQLHLADLRYADARGAFLVNADLRGANLQGAILWRVNLQGAVLRGANLQEAKLRQANLQGAVLSGADLQLADLRGANLQKADLRGANLQRAYLGEANLQGANLHGTVGLTVFQVNAARKWANAYYSHDFLTELGLRADHNKMLCRRAQEAPEWCRDFVDHP